MPDRTEKRADRLQLMLTHEEIDLVDDWRFRHRMPSRSAAVRALLRLAFETDQSGRADDAMHGVSSGEIGILSTNRVVDRTLGLAGKRRPLLILGDDPILAHAARSLLSDLQLPLDGPFDAADAVREAMRAARPRAVVLVARGPMSGLADLAEIAGAPGLPVLAVTGEGTGEGAPRPLEAARHIPLAAMTETLAAVLRDMLADEGGA